jgi:hypothetical protein
VGWKIDLGCNMVENHSYLSLFLRGGGGGAGTTEQFTMVRCLWMESGYSNQASHSFFQFIKMNARLILWNESWLLLSTVLSRSSLLITLLFHLAVNNYFRYSIFKNLWIKESLKYNSYLIDSYLYSHMHISWDYFGSLNSPFYKDTFYWWNFCG